MGKETTITRIIERIDRRIAKLQQVRQRLVELRERIDREHHDKPCETV